MEENQEIKNALDTSKERLALAFQNLESIIEQKFLSILKKDSTSEITTLKEKLLQITHEKEKLEANYTNIYEKYANIKLLNLEVVEELNNSIHDIEDILHGEHGNDSKHND
ncbi:MAG: DUF4164 family protein [Alphaproteobacteria bacterium]